MEKNARFAAIETLNRLQRNHKPLKMLFDQVAGECRLNAGDRQLAMKIAYGVLRQRDYLDKLLSVLCRRPTSRIKPFVYQALSSGLFQLFFLDRIPPSAAVNETVQAVKYCGFPKQVQGFVNGVLRQSQRRRRELPAPDKPDTIKPFFLNHPEWLTDRWKTRFGRDTMLRICAHNNREPDLCLRLTARTDRASFLQLLQEYGMEAIPGSYSAEAVIIKDFHGPVTKLPGFGDGFFQVQDQAAQLATRLLAPFGPGRRYLDCCAGLGGKTTHLVMLAGAERGSVSAVEPDPGRCRLLDENLSRLCPDQPVAIHQATLERFVAQNPEPFDAILLDAPCSGTGIIGRQPDIRWNRRCEDFAVYRERQETLLASAARLLAASGTLVYATCSIEPEENMEVIENFLARNATFHLTDAGDYLTGNAKDLLKDKCLASLPGPGIDGFFAARLSKTGKSD